MKVLATGKFRQVVGMDSASEITNDQRGSVIVCGSHGAPGSARLVLSFEPGAAIFHDAGRGKDDYAVSCIWVFDEAGVPCATVDYFSARICDADDMLESGVLSLINKACEPVGLRVGMSVREATERLLAHVDRSR